MKRLIVFLSAALFSAGSAHAAGVGSPAPITRFQPVGQTVFSGGMALATDQDMLLALFTINGPAAPTVTACDWNSTPMTLGFRRSGVVARQVQIVEAWYLTGARADIGNFGARFSSLANANVELYGFSSANRRHPIGKVESHSYSSARPSISISGTTSRTGIVCQMSTAAIPASVTPGPEQSFLAFGLVPSTPPIFNYASFYCGDNGTSTCSFTMAPAMDCLMVAFEVLPENGSSPRVLSTESEGRIESRIGAGQGADASPEMAIHRVDPAGSGGLSIDLSWPGTSSGRLALYDVTGRRLWETPMDGVSPGRHQFRATPNVASGAYWLSLTGGGRQVTHRVIVAR